jgi:hypothetical protein
MMEAYGEDLEGESMTEVALGWDVGAWHCEAGESRDSLFALVPDEEGRPRLAGNPWRGGLRETLNAFEGKALVPAILALVGIEASADSAVTLAIDTPLGWPKAFTDLLTHRRLPDSIHEMRLKNEILYRRTERILIENGHRPLSVVQDMISSQSTKGMFFVGKAGLAAASTGVWSAAAGPGVPRVTAIETYPAPCKMGGSLEPYFAAISGHERVVKACGGGRHVAADIQDALYCALVAFAFATDRGALRAPEECIEPVPAEEGWIWVPKQCYPSWAP